MIQSYMLFLDIYFNFLENHKIIVRNAVLTKPLKSQLKWTNCLPMRSATWVNPLGGANQHPKQNVWVSCNNLPGQ
jgi:hypothetical protein